MIDRGQAPLGAVKAHREDNDVRAARRLGACGCLVRTGWATDPGVVEKAAPDASVVVNSLAEAADWILAF